MALTMRILADALGVEITRIDLSKPVALADRDAMRRALDEYVIGGIETTIPLHRRLLSEADFLSGDYDIHWLETRLGL